MTGEVACRTRELLRQVCKAHDVEILKGHISKDHVHMFVSVPPHLSVSKLVQHLKGKSSRRSRNSSGDDTFGGGAILRQVLET